MQILVMIPSRYETGGVRIFRCVAKTHLSISDKSKLKAAPSNYVFEISDVRASIGAGFIYPIAGKALTMPGLPKTPRALDIDKDNKIVGLS